eukprot:TRINITY_DN5517_c0_g1_i3.p1 TRINITY_DN5517_c0_g1~~TRINITY_DN5517_c0_g1_i3.p1  ORF type:complete len:268 (+),score=24.32 TRINITY_DN5517_c0_g1_i3:127-930(+)
MCIRDRSTQVAAFAKPIASVGDSFAKISTVLSGKKEDFIAIQEAVKAISSMTVSKDSALSQLANMFIKPLKVEFADKSVTIATNITLEIDGEKFIRKTVNQKALVQILKNTQVQIHKTNKYKCLQLSVYTYFIQSLWKCQKFFITLPRNQKQSISNNNKQKNKEQVLQLNINKFLIPFFASTNRNKFIKFILNCFVFQINYKRGAQNDLFSAKNSLLLFTLLLQFQQMILQFEYPRQGMQKKGNVLVKMQLSSVCLLYTSPSPRDQA